MDKITKEADITNRAGSVTGIVGGVLTISGIALAPFTFSASLFLTVGGIGCSVGGGVASITAVVKEHRAVNEVKAIKNEILSNDAQVSNQILSLINQMESVRCKMGRWFKDQHDDNQVMSNMRSQINLVEKALSKMNGLRHVQLRAIRGLLTATGGIADTAATTLIDTGKISKISTKAVANGGRVVTGVAAIGVVLDVAMVAYLSHRINNGSKSDVAEDIRKAINVLEKQKDIYEEFYDGLCATPGPEFVIAPATPALLVV